MKIVYKPFGIIFGILAGLVSKKIFDFIWTRFDDQEPPKATTRNASLPKVLSAAAVQGVVFKSTRAAVDRYGARGFEYLTGSWPGDEDPDPAGIDFLKK
jgi:uncharacterized protein DUF4235